MAWQGSTRRTSPGDLGHQRLHPDEAHRFRHVRPPGTQSWYALLLKSHWDAAERRCHVARGLDLRQEIQRGHEHQHTPRESSSAAMCRLCVSKPFPSSL